VAIERALLTEVRREVPVVPTVIATERHARAPRGSAGDAHGDRHGVAAAAGVAHPAGPGVKAKERFRQFHLLRIDAQVEYVPAEMRRLTARSTSRSP
jgi:hypothetical protein